MGSSSLPPPGYEIMIVLPIAPGMAMIWGGIITLADLPGNELFILVFPKVRVNLAVVTRVWFSVKSVVRVTQAPDQIFFSNQGKMLKEIHKIIINLPTCKLIK